MGGRGDREGGGRRAGERRTRELAAYAGFDTGHLEAVDLVPELQPDTNSQKSVPYYMQSDCVRGLRSLFERTFDSFSLSWS